MSFFKFLEYKKYRWKWTNYPKKGKISRVPIHLDIELVAGKCNCRCVMCEMSFNPPEPTDMPFEMVKKIVDEFAEKGGNSIKFVYIGEPLLYPHLFEAIKYAKDKGVIDVMIATNGNLLNIRNTRQLVLSGLDLIIFSIDSCIPEIYKQIRINGDLDKVIENLFLLYMTKQYYNSNTPKVRIQAIPMNLNKEELESQKYHRFYKNLGDEIRISPFCEDYKDDSLVGETPDFFCNSVFQRMTIRADGKYALCCGERIDSKILGDVNENTIEEIWTSKEFFRIRNLIKEGKAHLIKACEACTFRREK